MASAYKTEFARNLVDILYIKRLMGKRENKNKQKIFSAIKERRKKKAKPVFSAVARAH